MLSRFRLQVEILYRQVYARSSVLHCRLVQNTNALFHDNSPASDIILQLLIELEQLLSADLPTNIILNMMAHARDKTQANTITLVVQVIRR